LNKLLKDLYAGANLHLPKDIRLDELSHPRSPKQRNAKCGDLNQIWRYGAEARIPTDEELEAKLSAINEWIRGQLS
jgi:hypothetical protein